MTSPETPAAAVWSRIRLADALDVPNIHRLIRQMAEFERLTDLFSATESSLASTLFPSPAPAPFHSFTVLILELSPIPISSSDNPAFPPVVRRTDLTAAVEDPEAAAFPSPRGEGLTVAGFLLCFPNYSSFMGKPGLCVEDIFVRAAEGVWANAAVDGGGEGCGVGDGDGGFPLTILLFDPKST